MDWYYYVATAIIFAQVLFLAYAYRNYRYALSKYQKERIGCRARTVLIVPCKDLDPNFDQNIKSFFDLDFGNYLLWFVVAERSDPAYERLCRLKSELEPKSKALEVEIFVAGHGESCSQKNHNLLYCYNRIGEEIEVLAFADSDICVRSNWLSQLVYPLQKAKNGAASGYRWFIPKKNNLASLALSAVNAKVAQLLGNTPFNQVWGGSMAIRSDVFRRLEVDKIWPKSLSDDLSLSYAVKKAGLKVAFVPACLVASYEATSWAKLFEFGRRQFLITRVSAARTWWFGLLSTLFSVLGLWGTAGVAIYAALTGQGHVHLFLAVPVLFFVGQMFRALLRQKMISKLLRKDYHKMKFAMVADILFFWVWSLLMLFFIISSAFGRTIVWRGIRYKLLGPTETIVIARGE